MSEEIDKVRISDSTRLQKEKDFHDKWAENIEVDKIKVITSFEGATAPENRWLLKHLGSLKGRQIVDLGCGAGEASAYFTGKGAYCFSCDYSPGMVSRAKKLLKPFGSSAHGCVLNAERLAFKNNSVDIVYAANVLHHVNAAKCLEEMHRILKPGGMACISEPLAHNPIINIYRRMADKVRTEDEHPLSISFLKNVKELFSSYRYDTFWFATLWILLSFYLFERIHPNKERYWKKIIYEETRLRRRYFQLEKIDKLIKRLPFLRRYAWTLAIIAIK